MKFQLSKKSIISSLLFIFILIAKPAVGAERIMLFKGIFSRTITVKELEYFGQTGKAKGFLKRAIKNEERELIQELLTDRYKTPIRLTSRLLYSKIGKVILKRASKIIYPYRIKNESTSVLALKAGTIKAIERETESLSIIDFFKAYPSKVIAIDVTELAKVINKVESMNDLVKFFSNSPLEKLKKQSP